MKVNELWHNGRELQRPKISKNWQGKVFVTFNIFEFFNFCLKYLQKYPRNFLAIFG